LLNRNDAAEPRIPAFLHDFTLERFNRYPHAHRNCARIEIMNQCLQRP